MGFAETVITLSEKGFFQFFVPFALSFLLIYGILLKTRIFTANKTKEDTTAIKMIYSITSFLLATLVLLFGINVYIEMFLAWVIGRAALIIILLVMGLIIASLMNANSGSGKDE